MPLQLLHKIAAEQIGQQFDIVKERRLIEHLPAFVGTRHRRHSFAVVFTLIRRLHDAAKSRRSHCTLQQHYAIHNSALGAQKATRDVPPPPHTRT